MKIRLGFAIGLLALIVIVGGAGYVLYASQIGYGLQSPNNSVSPNLQSQPNNSNVAGLPDAPVICANFSIPYTASVYIGSSEIGQAVDYNSITITVTCNGCPGPSSASSPYTNYPPNTPPQWSGTITGGSPFQSVSGICDRSFGISRSSTTGGTWQLSWNFENLNPNTGSLNVQVSLPNSNNTVLFNRSSGIAGNVTGSVTIP